MKQSRQNKNSSTIPQNGQAKRTRKGRDILEALKKKKEAAKLPAVRETSHESASSDSADLNKKVRFLTVDEGSNGQRLDNFLLRELKGVPKSHLYRVIRSGEVRINKGRCKAETKLQTGDVVRIPPISTAEGASKGAAPEFDEIPPVLYEDDDLLVVDKPAGLACHGGSGISYGLIERMRASRPELKFLELAHRLDKETSGVIVMAKSRKALVHLHEMMREGEVKKTYKTLVKGDWVNDRQHVKLPLHKYLTPSGERRVRVDQDEGQFSHTIFNLLKRYGEVSYLDVELKTGRTHQIRVHALSQGHPLVGDEKYGDFEFNKEVEKGSLGIPFKRMFLHAAQLDFNHPVTGVHLIIDSPLPKECAELIEVLNKRKSAKN